MFGGFQNGWSAGTFSDLSEKVQKLRTGLEAGLQDSGLLGPGEAPLQGDEPYSDAARSADAAVHAGSSPVVTKSNGDTKFTAAQNIEASSFDGALWVSNNSWNWDQDTTLSNPLGQSEDANYVQTTSASDHGWDDHQLELGVPDESTVQEPTDMAKAIVANAIAAAVGPDRQQHDARQETNLESRDQNLDSLDVLEQLPQAELGGGSALESTPNSDNGRAAGSNLGDAASSALPNGAIHAEGESGSLPAARAATIADLREASEGPDTKPPTPEHRKPSAKGSEKEGKSEDEVRGMAVEKVRAWALQLQATLQTRELQLERKFEEVASMQEVTQQLMARNEELARKSAKASEEDIKQLTEEMEARLGASERKVYALTKEREMLRRGNEKLASANDLLKEKDNIIAQVMAEGEQLSKKQLAQESTIKKLRQQLKEAEISRKELAAEAAAERSKVEETLEARQKAETDLAAAWAAHKTELEAEKGHYESLVARARSAQVEAENKAAVSAKEGLSRKLREAEMRAEMLAEQVSDLQMSMEQQRNAADIREDVLTREVADMERRQQESEARHDEVTTKLPEATRPLLRQIEGMQRTAAAHAQAWQAAQQRLQSRLQEAEAWAASAAEKERLASDRLQAADSRASTLEAALDAVREECSDLRSQLHAQEEELRATRQRRVTLEQQGNQLLSKLDAVESEKAEAERSAEARVHDAEMRSTQMLAAAEARAAALEDRLRQADPMAAATPLAGDPPAMAGPGYKWVLQREHEDPQSTRHSEVGGVAPSARVGYMNGLLRATAPELERMRDALLQKEEQLAACRNTISELEATRDRLAEELVSLSQTAEKHSDAWRELENARREHSQTQQRLIACTELLGEREEKILEQSADIADLKALYREQIEYVLDMAVPSSGAASSVSSWVPGAER